jgi:endoglucanase
MGNGTVSCGAGVFKFGFQNQMPYGMNVYTSVDGQNFVLFAGVDGGEYQEACNSASLQGAYFYVVYDWENPTSASPKSTQTVGAIVSQNQYYLKVILAGGASIFSPPLALPSVASAPRKNAKGELIAYSVKGNTIVDQDGSTVTLKGVARPSLEWSPTGQSLSPIDVQNMKSFGANIVRLSLNQTFWLDTTDYPDYQTIVDQMIAFAFQSEMDVILDLHILAAPPLNQPAVQSPMANLQSPTFWQQVATKYAGYGSILFELYNEPFTPSGGPAVTPQIWNAGDGQNYAGMQQLYNAVRAAGASNVCIVNGLDYGYDLSFLSSTPSLLISGTNVVYGAHPYNFGGKQPSDWPTYFGFLIPSYPVIFTEFGNNTQGTYLQTSYIQSVLSYVDANSLHYTSWGWFPADLTNPWFPCVITDFGTPTPTPFLGALVQQDLQQHPGTSGARGGG